MKKLLVGAVAVVALSAGAYAYLVSAAESNIESLAAEFNTSEDHELVVRYDDLDISLLSGSVELAGVQFVNRSDESKAIKVNNAVVSIDFWTDGDLPAISAAELTAVDMSAPEFELGVGKISFEGFDLNATTQAVESKELENVPLGSLSMDDLKVISTKDQNVELTLGEFRFETTNGGQDLVELSYNDIAFTFDDPQKTTMSLEEFTIKGGDLALLAKLISKGMQSEEEGNGADTFMQSIAADYSAATINYGGVDSFEMLDFKIATEAGFGMSIDEYYLRDVKRSGGIVVAGKTGITNFEVPTLKGLSPQMDQILAIAQHDGLRMNLLAQSDYDADTSELVGETSFVIDDLVSLSSEFSMQNINLQKMAEAMIEFQSMQFESAAADIAAAENGQQVQDPTAELAETIDAMLAAYIGYYDSFAMNIDLKDSGLNTKFLNVYSAMTGATPDQLRASFVQLGTVNLSSALGTSTPPNLQQSLELYLAETSKPIRLEISSNESFDSEAVSTLDAENWHTVLDIGITDVPN